MFDDLVLYFLFRIIILECENKMFSSRSLVLSFSVGMYFFFYPRLVVDNGVRGSLDTIDIAG